MDGGVVSRQNKAGEALGSNMPGGGARFFKRIFVRLISLAMLFCAVWATAPAGALTLRGNLRDDIPNIDPASFNGPVANRLLSLVYEGLTRFTEDGRILPALATAWETPDGGRTWRFHLRADVRFHSGRLFTARDVRYSFETMLRAKRPSFSAAFLDRLKGRAAFVEGRAAALSGLVIVDPLTVELHFSEPVTTFPVFPFFIFDSGAAADGGDGWFNSMSGGTGPFKLAEWRRGQEVRLEAHQSYWNGAPATQELRLLVTSSVEKALTMFEAGELDFVHVGEAAFRLVMGDSARRARAQLVERRQARFLGMNPALYPPFADARVRAAFSLAMDRQAVIDGIYAGLARTAPGYAVSTLAPAAEGEEDTQGLVHRFDPTAAQALLAQAGYPGGKGLPPLELNVIESSRDEGAFYADQLNRLLGVPVTVRALERAAIIAAANAGALPFFLGGWTADFPEPLTYLGSLWHSASRFNQARLRDEVYDRLIDAARQTIDSAARRRLYVQAEKRLAETAAVAMLPTPFNMLLRNERAAAVSINAFGGLSFATSAVHAGP
jgi:oligopeptide transport system substrate-binding protein